MEWLRLPRLGWRPRVGALLRERERDGRHPLRRAPARSFWVFFLGFVLLPAAFAAESPRVELSDGRLSVEAHDVAVQDLLEEIARQTGLVMSFPDPLSGRVTTEFDNLEIPVAIDRVLHGMSYALQYAHGAPVSRLWVFTSGASNSETGAEPSAEPESFAAAGAAGAAGQDGVGVDDEVAVRLETVAALAERETDPFAFALASAVADESPAVRYEAVYALGEIGGDLSAGLLQHALLDSDADVRAAAVDALAGIEGDQSASALAAVLADPDPALRENVVYALGEIGGETATELLRQASSDADEWVREAAVEMLRDLSAGETADSEP